MVRFPARQVASSPDGPAPFGSRADQTGWALGWPAHAQGTAPHGGHPSPTPFVAATLDHPDGVVTSRCLLVAYSSFPGVLHTSAQTCAADQTAQRHYQRRWKSGSGAAK